MVTKKITVISKYCGANNFTIEIKKDEDGNGGIKITKATIRAFDGELYLNPSELESLVEVVKQIQKELN